MKIPLLNIANLCIVLLTLTACSKHSANADGSNAIYYWRTTFSLNEAERDFLKKHDISKLYIHFFDVDDHWKDVNGKYVIPEATIQFKDSVPHGIEVVPTIYITNSAMEQMQLKEDEYAGKILKRVNAICRCHGIRYNELQLDCDWTKNTRKYFFKLCEEMKQRMDTTQILSSTIRLHQLVQDVPPVDKGVLMVYNTGNLMVMTTYNSIFSRKDIEPYLRDNRLAKYSLPLDVAYPAYGWSVVFRQGYDDKYHFKRIMRRTDFSDYPQIKEIDENIYQAESYANFAPDDMVFTGDLIRVERPTADEIIEIKAMIDRQLKGKSHNNILYYLDKSQLSHYSGNEIDKIYSRN